MSQNMCESLRINIISYYSVTIKFRKFKSGNLYFKDEHRFGHYIEADC